MDEIYIMKAHCNTCGGERNHERLNKILKNWSEGVGGGYPLSGGDTYFVLECRGCESVRILHESWFSEDTDENGELRLRLDKLHHGNYSVSYMDRDFLKGSDYVQIRQTAEVLGGLIAPGAHIVRGEQKRAVTSFKQAIEWLLEEAKHGVNIQRYKGLGEMNPEQLWETTMDVTNRVLLKVGIEDLLTTDEIFTTLMGDIVEPRRAFIEQNALGVKNLDV